MSGRPDFTGALCTADPDRWFPSVVGKGSRREQREAAVICQDCPVRAPCAEYALANRISVGVWGGLTENERAALR
jgi:WhiB family redox-sensing transcriptional regulator